MRREGVVRETRYRISRIMRAEDQGQKIIAVGKVKSSFQSHTPYNLLPTWPREPKPELWGFLFWEGRAGRRSAARGGGQHILEIHKLTRRYLVTTLGAGEEGALWRRWPEVSGRRKGSWNVVRTNRAQGCALCK